MPQTPDEVSRAPLDLTGQTWAATPPMDAQAGDEWRVVLEGTFRFAETGQTFDAVYRLTNEGAVLADQPHTYLQWRPFPLVLERADPARHRYVFRVPAGAIANGESVGVRLNVDRFVDETFLEPSQVKNALSGDLTVSVLRTPPVVPWGLYAAEASVPAALAIGGVGLLVRRRIILGGLDADLVHAIGRIEQKARVARQAATRAHRASVPQMTERFSQLARGAQAVARQAQDLRNAQRLVDRQATQREIGALERRLAAGKDDEGAAEARATLNEKRHALARLDEMKQGEEVCGLRLAKIEAVLDSAALTLRSARATARAAPSEDALRHDLDAEVRALHEVERDLATRKTGQAELIRLSSRNG